MPYIKKKIIVSIFEIVYFLQCIFFILMQNTTWITLIFKNLILNHLLLI